MGNSFDCHALESRLLLSAGDLDTSFGQAGYVDLPAAKGSWDAIAPLSNGDFVLVGERTNKTNHNDGLLVARYTSTWSLDSTFGASGVAELPLVTGGDIDLSIRPDHKLIIGGEFGGVDETVRLAANGAVDTTFGKAGFVKGFIAQSLQPDGSMIGIDGFSLQRRTPRGGLIDPTFADGGLLDLRGSQTNASFETSPLVQIQSDDKIVVAAELTQEKVDKGLVVRRLLPNGQADPSFAGGTAYSDPASTGLAALKVADDGRIFLAAYNSTLSTGLFQLTAAGQLVQSFAPDAFVVSSIALSSNGDIDALVAGDFDSGVEQILPDGSTDPRFDAGRSFTLYDFDSAPELILTPAKKLLVIGDRYNDTSQAFSPTLSQLTTQDDGSPIQRYSHSNLVVVYGTNNADHISETHTSTSFTFTMNGASKTFLRANVLKIDVDAGSGDDSIDIDGKGTGITVDGGDGNDHIVIRSGDIASITGDSGDDFIDGSGVNPQTSGGIYVDGGTGNDHIIGSPHDDYLEGGHGNDTIDGGGSTGDAIYGNGGDDVLLHTNFNTHGGTGNDTLYGVGRGDAGDDTYYIRDGQFETIYDLEGNNRAQIDDSKTVHDTLNGTFTIIP